MKLTLTSNSYDYKKTLLVEWEDFDLTPLDLDAFDFALLRECEASHSMADKLLAMEMLVRKYEKANGLPTLTPPPEASGGEGA